MRKLIFLILILTLTVTIPLSAQNDPKGVVEAFLSAWNDADYDTMYSYLHPQSQELYPAAAFSARYQQIQQTITLNGLTFEIGSTRLQGDSAAVTYDLTLTTDTFGDINDPDRIMRLVNTPNGWKIAWSSMDIFDGLAGEARLQAFSQQPPRAVIYDRNGLPLAWESGTSTAIYSSQQAMFNVNDCIALIGEISLESVSTLQLRFGSNAPETIFWLGSMPTETYNAYSAELEEICGVTPNTNLVFESGLHRQYYGGRATAHVTGYVGPVQEEQLAALQAQGFAATDTVGLDGIEKEFNVELAGQSQRVLQIVEPGGTVLRQISRTEGSPPVPVQLTIDRDLQRITAQAVSDAYNYAAGNWGAPDISSGGAAVVLDAKTSEILALVSYPMFDPALFNPNANSIENRGVLISQIQTDARRPLRNHAISEQESPGSTFKLVTAAAILNEGLIAPDEIFNCELNWEGQPFGDTLEIRQDWRVVDEMEAAGEITPAQAIMSSCNPFFWQYGAILHTQVGANTLPSYARRMGIGITYGLQSGYPETAGTISAAPSVDIAINEAVGQGNITVAPIHMAVLTAGIANDGELFKPSLVKQVGGFDGTEVSFTASPERMPDMNLAPEVLDTLQEGMCGVTTVEDLGTAYIRFGDPTEEFATLANYSVCGKTGTAQTARYPNAWFVAYTPADDPQLAIAVMVRQSLEGSQVAAPIVRRILDDYYNEPRSPYPSWWNEETYNPLDVPAGAGSG